MRGVGDKMNKLLIFPIILILSLNIVLAADMLEISDITLDYNYDSQRITKENQTYGEFIEPGDSFKLNIEVKNGFKTSTDIDDVVITITIYNITENFDLVKSASSFDLNPNERNSKRITIDIPSNAEELPNLVKVYAIGKGEDGNYYSATKTFYINIEDDDHNVYIYNSVFSPSTIACNQTTNLYVWIYNDGSYNEGDVVLKVYNKELNIDKVYSGISIKKGVKYGKTIGLGPYIANKVTTYPIEVKVYYKNNILDDTKTVNLFVNPCPIGLVKNITSSSNETEQAPDVVVTDSTSTDNIEIKGYTTKSSNVNRDSSNDILILSVILIGLFIIGFMINKIRKNSRIEVY